jgi:hypothetical protein
MADDPTLLIQVPAGSAIERQLREELGRHRDEVERVVRQAGTGTAPLVIAVEAGELFQDAEVEPVIAAARSASRPVIVRVARPSER